jgi:hypothetical protein
MLISCSPQHRLRGCFSELRPFGVTAGWPGGSGGRTCEFCPLALRTSIAASVSLLEARGPPL